MVQSGESAHRQSEHQGGPLDAAGAAQRGGNSAQNGWNSGIFGWQEPENGSDLFLLNSCKIFLLFWLNLVALLVACWLRKTTGAENSPVRTPR